MPDACSGDMYSTVPISIPCLVRARVALSESTAKAAVESFARPKSRILTSAILTHHDVLGLQIPVHDARSVRFGDSVRELAGEIEKALRLERAVGQRLSQRRAFRELHGDIAAALALADVVDVDDVGMG